MKINILINGKETLCKVVARHKNGDIRVEYSCYADGKYAGVQTHTITEEEFYGALEDLTEKALCNQKCLCPTLKESGLCSGCEVFMALRDYYKQESGVE